MGFGGPAVAEGNGDVEIVVGDSNISTCEEAKGPWSSRECEENIPRRSYGSGPVKLKPLGSGRAASSS
jgi:hypothetical protein